MAQALTIADLRDAARRRLPRALFDTIEGGAGDEAALRRNVEDLAGLAIVPRVLRDVAEIDPSVELLGRPTPLPLILGPTGMNGFYWPDGELAVAAAAQKAGLVYVVSAVSSVTLERLAAPGRRLWFQLYPLERQDINEDLIRRARAAGYEALVVTIDVPRMGRRLRDLRNGVRLPPRLGPRLFMDVARHPRWAWPFIRGYRPGFANLAGYDLGFDRDSRRIATPRFDPRMDWVGLSHLARLWGGPLIVKGVMHADDIRSAAELGATAVVLSNHGGRQLDCAPSTLSALAGLDPGKFPLDIYIDGGIRSGGDIAKLYALGAKACLVGRSYLYGLAAAGELGVTAALQILDGELRDTMALAGHRLLATLDRETLYRRG